MLYKPAKKEKRNISVGSGGKINIKHEKQIRNLLRGEEKKRAIKDLILEKRPLSTRIVNTIRKSIGAKVELSEPSK